MSRNYAASLGALAMALVVLRGAIRGEPARDVAGEAIVVMLVFACVGALAGRIADYLIRDSLETAFRKRVDWYREGISDMASEEADSPENV